VSALGPSPVLLTFHTRPKPFCRATGRNEEALQQPLALHLPLCLPSQPAQDDDDAAGGRRNVGDRTGDDASASLSEQSDHQAAPGAQRLRGFANLDTVFARLSLWVPEEHSLQPGLLSRLEKLAARWPQSIALDLYDRLRKLERPFHLFSPLMPAPHWLRAAIPGTRAIPLSCCSCYASWPRRGPSRACAMSRWASCGQAREQRRHSRR